MRPTSAICYCMFLPCLLPINAIASIHRKISRKKYSWKNDVKPLPRRRNSLTANVAPAPQLNCDLLNRLPLELRQEIYGYVFGGAAVHLVQIPRRIAHSRCRSAKVWDKHRYCRPAIQGPLFPCLGSVANGNLALLKTCRQIYSEASKILYAVNTFDVNRLSTFLSFTETIIPARLAAIRRLHICWDVGGLGRYGPSGDVHVDSNFRSWLRCWDIIASKMPGLQHLKLHLKTVLKSLSIHEDWVLPMYDVTGLRTVEIYLDHLGQWKNAKILRRTLVATMTSKKE